MKRKIYWKVVSVTPHGFCSAMYDVFVKSKIEYNFGSWTCPEDDCGPLCVFGTRKDARDFAGAYQAINLLTRLSVSRYPLRVYRCYIEPATLSRQQVMDTYGFATPAGTQFASAVKLLKKGEK